MAKYFQIDECWFSETCTAQALKRACCWGKSIEEVRKAYKRHLDTSGHHSNLTAEQKSVAMEEVEILERNLEDDKK